MGDLVVEFGSVNVDNFKTLQDIGTLVQHSQEVGVVIYTHCIIIEYYAIIII